jgi:CRISPR/Cas system-associated endonuclease/helicase Cas3
MESSGFFQATTKFSSKELIFILKIVSDNELKSVNFENSEEIYNIIIEKESVLKNFCNHLLNLNKMTLHKNQNIFNEETERIFNKINLTFTEKQQMRTLLKLYFLKNSKLKFDLLNESKSGSYNIKKLKKYLSL